MNARALPTLVALLLVSCGSEPRTVVVPCAPAPKEAAPPVVATPAAPRITVSFPAALSSAPLDGHLLVVLSKDGSRPPIEQLSDSDATAQAFGLDVDAMAPGRPVAIDPGAFGYPIRSLADVPAGDYVVQALLHRYETFTLGDGRTLKLPPDRGEGQDMTKAPGNLVSEPRRVRFDPSAGEAIAIELASALPPLPPVADTKYVKHVRIQSERLTRFWGRPTYLGATVLLPEGWDSHHASHYPLLVMHGHFSREPGWWRETPPDASLPAPDMANLSRHCPNGHEGAWCTKFGYERLQQELAYQQFRRWTGKAFPRVLVVEIHNANPYYDDSYAVNSANIGPYGDAITYELVPYLEKTFRGLGAWARGVIGGSTGGWESLAVQVFYPEEYNGAIASCPDPIDFHAYETVNLYADPNAYYDEGPFRRTPRPEERDYLGRVRTTVEQANFHELVMGTRGRSGGQFDAWQAVFSPAGSDGYPAPIWDKRTGVVDPAVATYWRDHYDLGRALERDWARLAPLLRGKITIHVGLSDNFFLNDAVYRVDEFLKSAKPPADAVVDYGLRDEHCWSGDRSTFNAVSRMTYVERFVPQLAQHWLKTAPRGADVTSWRY